MLFAKSWLQTTNWKNSKNELQDAGGFPTIFDYLNELKPCFSFLANDLIINKIVDGSPLRQPFVTNLSAVKMKLTEMQEDIAIKQWFQTLFDAFLPLSILELFFPPLLHESAAIFDLQIYCFSPDFTCHGVAYCSGSWTSIDCNWKKWTLLKTITWLIRVGQSHLLSNNCIKLGQKTCDSPLNDKQM